MSPCLPNVIISGLVGNWLFAIGRNSPCLGTRTLADNYCNGCMWSLISGYLHRGDCAVAEREEPEFEVENILGKEVGEL
jgi:hypothetical protein